MTPDEVARRCADLMWADDKASQALNVTIEHITPGAADVSMMVRETMTNGHGMCHGGYIFTLADTAFAFACNTYNQRCVAQHGSIAFVAPAHLGMRLRASARERQRSGRSGVYDVTVTEDSGAVVAEFRGLSRTVAGTFF